MRQEEVAAEPSRYKLFYSWRVEILTDVSTELAMIHLLSIFPHNTAIWKKIDLEIWFFEHSSKTSRARHMKFGMKMLAKST